MAYRIKDRDELVRAMHKHITRPASRRPSATVARELLQKVRDVGGDVERIVRNCGLTALPDAILQPGWRGPITRDQFVAVYRDCIIALEDHDSRRQGRPPMTKGEVDMLCYCVINCATLADVIDRATRFCALLDGRAGELSLTLASGQAEFRMHTFRRRRDVIAFLSDMVGLSTYYRLFSWLIGENIEPLGIEVCYAPLIEDDLIAGLMPHPVSYDCSDNLLRFPAAYLRRPVVRTYGEMVGLLEVFPFDMEVANSKRTPLSEVIGNLIGNALARHAPLPTLETLAAQFSISTATLKRRLADEGVSIQQLKERGRHHLALELLADPALSFGEIAHRLSFSDATTFSRAFRGWTRQSPSMYRKRLAGSTDR